MADRSADRFLISNQDKLQTSLCEYFYFILLLWLLISILGLLVVNQSKMMAITVSSNSQNNGMHFETEN